MENNNLPEGSIYLGPNEGRKYDMGFMQAVFKADEEETDSCYSISEWWLDAHSEGPGAHLHEDNDEVFYVIEGRPSILVGEEWITAAKGAFLRIPRNTMHDFTNRSGERIGLLNFFIPGGFERNMPAIVKWFDDSK